MAMLKDVADFFIALAQETAEMDMGDAMTSRIALGYDLESQQTARNNERADRKILYQVNVNRDG